MHTCVLCVGFLPGPPLSVLLGPAVLAVLQCGVSLILEPDSETVTTKLQPWRTLARGAGTRISVLSCPWAGLCP